MSVCSRCGSENTESATFCQECHAYLGSSAATAEADEVQVRARKPDRADSEARESTVGLFVALPVDRIGVDPGGEVACEVRVGNLGTIVDRFLAAVEGPAAGWVEVDPAALSLMPDTEGACRLWFRPPRSPTSTAGDVPFAVVVRSSSDPSKTRAAEGIVEIRPFTDTRVRLVPQESRGEQAEHRLLVDNGGNATLRLTVEASDPRDALVVDPEPMTLAVAPGTTGSAVLTVRPRAPVAEPLQHRVDVLARADDGTEHRPHAVFIQEAPAAPVLERIPEIPPSEQITPPSAPVVGPHPRGKGYLASVVGAVVGALAMGVPLGLLGGLLGSMTAADDIGGLFAIVFLVVGLAGLGLWAGAAVGAWRALRLRHHHRPAATGVAVAVAVPVLVGLGGVLGGDALGGVLVAAGLIAAPLAARAFVLTVSSRRGTAAPGRGPGSAASQ